MCARGETHRGQTFTRSGYTCNNQMSLSFLLPANIRGGFLNEECGNPPGVLDQMQGQTMVTLGAEGEDSGIERTRRIDLEQTQTFTNDGAMQTFSCPRKAVVMSLACVGFLTGTGSIHAQLVQSNSETMRNLSWTLNRTLFFTSSRLLPTIPPMAIRPTSTPQAFPPSRPMRNQQQLKMRI